VRDRIVIVVDDGLATGSTMRAAIKALHQKAPKQIVVAAPVGARETCDSLENEVDVVCVCARTPEPFQAVGLWYANFEQTTDDEVRNLLTRAMPEDQRKAAA
jgi:putative phosphoribosyl transferase